MKKGKGIQIGNNYDLLITSMRLQIGDTQPQNQALIVSSNPGEWKQFPELGVGIESWLLDENPGNISSEVKRHLKADGFNVDSVEVDNNQLLIDAYY